MTPFLYFVAVIYTARQALDYDLTELDTPPDRVNRDVDHHIWWANARCNAALHGRSTLETAEQYHQRTQLPGSAYGVFNDAGYLVPCMDGGKTLHHGALWATIEQAERFADKMREINRTITYDVQEVTLHRACRVDVPRGTSGDNRCPGCNRVLFGSMRAVPGGAWCRACQRDKVPAGAYRVE